MEKNMNVEQNIKNNNVSMKDSKIEECNEDFIIYNNEKEKSVKIFGHDFVYHNRDKLEIIYENKTYDLMEKF